MNGNDIRPPTIGEHLRDGYRTLEASCEACGHEAIVDVTRFTPRVPLPDAALKRQCSACGSRRIMVRLNMSEHYEKMRREYGWSVGR